MHLGEFRVAQARSLDKGVGEPPDFGVGNSSHHTMQARSEIRRDAWDKSPRFTNQIAEIHKTNRRDPHDKSRLHHRQLEADGLSMGKSVSKKNYMSPYSQRYKK